MATDGNQSRLFLDRVFSSALDARPDLHLSIHTLHPAEGAERRRLSTRWFSGGSAIDEAARHAETAGKAGSGCEVYIGACPARERPRSGRGGKEIIGAVPALWADIDIAGDGHSKKAYPPSYDAACEMLSLIGVRPSIVINSGYGLWAWWILREPILIGGDGGSSLEVAAETARRWHLTVAACARSKGWVLDSVFDISRIARMPGTYNHKMAEPRLSHIYDRPGVASGETYTIEELERFMVAPELADPPPPTPAAPAHQRIEVGVIMLAPDREPRASVIEAATANDPQFAETWDKSRKDMKDQSPSAYDLALCNFAAKANLSDQDMADLMIGFRKRHKLDIGKALRRDYVMRTIAKARASGMQAQAIRRLSEGGEGTMEGGAEETEEARRQVLDDLSKALWGVKVLRFLQVGRENSIYYAVIQTAEGPKEIKIGGLAAVREPSKFTEPITNWTRIPLPRFKLDTWDGIYRSLLRICETIESPELHDSVQGRGYVLEYLRRSSIATEPRDVADAAERARPFVADGCLHVHADTLRRNMRQRQDVSVSGRDLTHLLRAGGFRSKPVTYRTEGGKTTSRYYWIIALDDIINDLPAALQERLSPPPKKGGGPAPPEEPPI